MLYLDPEITRDAGLTMGQVVRVQMGNEARLVRVGPMLTSLLDEGAAFLPAALFTDAREATIESEAAVPTLSRVVVTSASDASHGVTKEAVIRLAERRPILHSGDLLDLGPAGSVRIVACTPKAGLLNQETDVRVGEYSSPTGDGTQGEVDRMRGMVAELERVRGAVAEELRRAEASFERLSKDRAKLDDECEALEVKLAEVQESAARELEQRAEMCDQLEKEVEQLRQRAQLGPPTAEREWKAP